MGVIVERVVGGIEAGVDDQKAWFAAARCIDELAFASTSSTSPPLARAF